MNLFRSVSLTMLCCVPLLLWSASRAGAQDADAGYQPFDECGVLVAGNGCVVLDTGGGRYVVADPDDFAFGDYVRVIGTLNPDCVVICDDIDGCIAGADVYDAGVYPCGTHIPQFPEDAITGACTAASTLLAVVCVAGLYVTRRAPRTR